MIITGKRGHMITFTGKQGGTVSIGTDGGIKVEGKKLDVKPGEAIDITGPGLSITGLQVVTTDAPQETKKK